MKELKFKNALFSILSLACLCTFGIILLGGGGILSTCILEESKDLNLCFLIFGIALLVVWLLAGFAVLINRTVVVTSTEIKLCRGNKVKWTIKKEDLQECIYNEVKWYDFLLPILNINAFGLQFRLKERKSISREFCSLSLKQVKQIQEEFDYPIKIIGSVSEQ